MSDFFDGLDDPLSVSPDVVDGGFYDSGSFSSSYDNDFSLGGSMPMSVETPPTFAPDPAFDTAPSYITDSPTLPSPSADQYFQWDYADASEEIGADPLEAPSGPSSVQRAMKQGSASSGSIWSAIGAGGAAGANVLLQGQSQIPSNPRGIQTTGLYLPQPAPSQTLQPSTGARVGAAVGGTTQTGVLLLILAGVLLIWIAKR